MENEKNEAQREITIYNRVQLDKKSYTVYIRYISFFSEYDFAYVRHDVPLKILNIIFQLFKAHEFLLYNNWFMYCMLWIRMLIARK